MPTMLIALCANADHPPPSTTERLIAQPLGTRGTNDTAVTDTNAPRMVDRDRCDCRPGAFRVGQREVGRSWEMSSTAPGPNRRSSSARISARQARAAPGDRVAGSVDRPGPRRCRRLSSGRRQSEPIGKLTDARTWLAVDRTMCSGWMCGPSVARSAISRTGSRNIAVSFRAPVRPCARSVSAPRTQPARHHSPRRRLRSRYQVIVVDDPSALSRRTSSLWRAWKARRT